jgi:hypothetical protein
MSTTPLEVERNAVGNSTTLHSHLMVMMVVAVVASVDDTDDGNHCDMTTSMIDQHSQLLELLGGACKRLLALPEPEPEPPPCFLRK